MFIGTHIHGVDAKGRVSSPAEFRAQATREGLEGVYLWPALDGVYLCGCGGELMARYEQALRQSDPFDGPAHPGVSMVLSRARLFKFDATGRITLPKKLVDDAGLDGQGVFVGRGDRFEVWSVAGWEAHSAAETLRAQDNSRALGELAQLQRQVELLEQKNALEARLAAARDGLGGAGGGTIAGYDSGPKGMGGVSSTVRGARDIDPKEGDDA